MPRLPLLRASLLLLLAAASLTSVACPAVAATPVVPAMPDDATLAARIDALLSPIFPADQPGAAVLVARDGRSVYRRGFGLGDLERKTTIAPEMVFRIGSVTKQFTAALVMRLVEQGRLGLQDDLTKYLPDYPTGGQGITIEHLLTHTSGIASYTDQPAWAARMAEDMTQAQIIDLFKNVPRGFDPGTKWAYSNSGYFLLGVIIEKVTGKSYAQGLADEILTPLGMQHSGCGRSTPSFPGEVSGYERRDDKVVPAEPLSMTSPFAAGVIVSSVDDLLRWDDGLNTGRVLQPASLERIFTPYVLKDGQATGYGYGWGLTQYEGHRIQEHAGGINGFFAHVMRLPDDHLYVALLFNCGSPAVDGSFLALKIAAAAVGRPLPEPGDYTMSPEQLDRFVGVYEADPATTRAISREGGQLYSQRGGGARLEIFPTSDSTFAYVGRATRVKFRFAAAGRADRMIMSQSGIEQVSRRTDKPLPPPRTAITLDPAGLEACVGAYELAPGFRIVVTREGARLMAQATDQPKFEIFPESPTLFFLKVVDAQIEFHPGPDGRMSTMVLHQGGQDMPGKRVAE